MGDVIEFRKGGKEQPKAETEYWICPECDCREMHLSSFEGVLIINCADCEQEIVLSEVTRLDTGN